MTIRVLARAQREIVAQAEYYQAEASEDVALRWRAAVNDAIRSLQTLPERGTQVISGGAERHGLRKLHVHGFPDHLIFYRFRAETRTVTIVGMLHGARDLEALVPKMRNR